MELSRTIANAQVLINLGLLSVLLQVVRSYTTEIKLHTLSAQIVANLSQFEALHHQIFQSGLNIFVLLINVLTFIYLLECILIVTRHLSYELY